MRNILDKFVKKMKKKHIFLSTTAFLRKLHRLLDNVENVVETEGPQMTSQYGANALHVGLERLHARVRMHTPTRPGTHMHARKQTEAHM